MYGTKSGVVFEEIEQTEKDLVSRKEATRHLKKRLMETAINNVGIKENADYVYSEMAENRVDIWMDELPAVQPERKTGRITYTDFSEELWGQSAICISCGCRWQIAEEGEDNFCPNCGARMIQEGENNERA